MTYLLTGNPDAIAKVLQENRIRTNRGEIRFTPFRQMGEDNHYEIIASADTDDKAVFDTDTKDVVATDTKCPKCKKKK